MKGGGWERFAGGAGVACVRGVSASPSPRTFSNPRYHEDRSWLDVMRWKLTSRPAAWPAHVAVEPQPVGPAPVSGLRVTWVNHATFLVQAPRATVLIDPLWSECAGPFGRIGPRRVHAPGVRFEELPRIDAVLLSHDHYDHCDLPTLRWIARRWPEAQVVTPRRNGDLARRAGFRADRITELAWWEGLEATAGGGAQTGVGLPGLSVSVTPARHWSNRLSGARNGRLWGGFFLRETASGRAVFCSGDTAYDDEMFRDVRMRLGAPDLALLPIGAYEPRWFMCEQHCNPEEAVRIHRELGAARSVGMHWGCFQLTDEARETPVRALAEACAAQGVAADKFITLAPGGSVVV